MNDDSKCAKCGNYSGGATLCRKCEKAKVKTLRRLKLRKWISAIFMVAALGCEQPAQTTAVSTPAVDSNASASASTGVVAQPEIVSAPAVETPIVQNDAPIIAVVPPVDVAHSFTLTVYSITAVRAPQPGWPTKTYTSTGKCVLYTGDVYCWDDGKKTLVVAGISLYYSYWNINRQGAGFGLSGGGMSEDILTEPTLVTHHLSLNLASGALNEMLTSGQQTDMVCSESNGIVTCGDFAIDLSKAAL